MTLRSRIGKFLLLSVLMGLIYPISGLVATESAAATASHSPVITSVTSPNNQTLVITYTPPVSADTITHVLYSTDSGTTYYAPDSDTCAADPRNGTWIANSDTCTMTVTLESFSQYQISSTFLQPGVPHTLVLGTYTSSIPPGSNPGSNPNVRNSNLGDVTPPTDISNSVVVSGDTSGAGIAPFPAITSIFYGENFETVYFDNSIDVNKWWGIAYSLDTGTTWTTVEDPGANFSCSQAQYAISINFYSCSIYGLTGESNIQFRYYVDPVGEGSDLQSPTDPTQFESGTPSENIHFIASNPQTFTAPYQYGHSYPKDLYIFDQTVQSANGTVQVTGGEQSITLNFTAPPITTIGGSGSFRNVYYAYAAIPDGTPVVFHDDMQQWNFNQSDLKIIDGLPQQSWTITRQSNGQPLQDGTTYDLALAYYIPGLSRYISPAQIDSNGNGDPYVFLGMPVATPPTFTHPLAPTRVSASIGTYFSDSVTATGGIGPYTYGITSGALPPGVTLDSTTGIFSGTPTAPGTFTPVLSATSATGGYSTLSGYSIVIAGPQVARPDNNYWLDHPTPDPSEGNVSYDWSSLASSDNGSHLVGVEEGGAIFTSNDYGNTWVMETTTSAIAGLGWSFVTSSSDGSHLAATASNGGGLWTSTDYGFSWSLKLDSSGIGNFSGLASSSDGMRIAALVSGGDLWTSADQGDTWTAVPLPAGLGGGASFQGNGSSIATNNSGSQLIVLTNSGTIAISHDYGVNWDSTTSTSYSNYGVVSSSADGKILAVAPGASGVNDHILISTDYGATFNPAPNSPIGGWLSLTSSSDGSHFAAIAPDSLTNIQRIWTSPDTGTSWYEAASTDPAWQNAYWGTVTSNADGSFIIAGGNDSDLWSGPAEDYDATLTSGAIRAVGIANLGIPSQSLSTTTPGVDTLTITSAWDSSLQTLFTTQSTHAAVTKIVKYASGASDSTFSSDTPFTNQKIANGDYLDIEVTSQKGTKLYYKVAVVVLPGTVAPDFTANVLSFGPTVIGQSETQTVRLHILTSKANDSFGVSQCGCFLSLAANMQSTVGTLSVDADPTNVTDGCFGELQNDTYCNIVIHFTPTIPGSQEIPLSLNFSWDDTSTPPATLTQQEILGLNVTTLAALIVPNPPLVWESHTVASNQLWQSITSSADGSHLAAVINNGDIYTSADGGKTWIDRAAAGNRYWSAITSSADGSKLFATDIGYPLRTSYEILGANGPAFLNSNGYIYKSSDYGQTWESVTAAGEHTFSSIATSADGRRLIASVFGGNIETSTDGGITWNESSPSTGNNSYTSVASSSDGIHLAVSEDGDGDTGYVYTSADGGLTWTYTDQSGVKWISIASNSDGSRLVGNDFNGDLWTSADFGVNWTDQTSSFGSLRWTSIASSYDGSHLAATASSWTPFSVPGYYIYLSSDYGVTWETATVPGANDWNSIAMSADGNLLAAVATNSDIWTLRSAYVPPAPAPSTTPVPDPVQQSRITTISPTSTVEGASSQIVLSGYFVENIVDIRINGIALPQGSWKQTGTTITLNLPAQVAGDYLIQLYNGASPVLVAPNLSITKAAAVAPAPAVIAPKPAPVVVAPTPAPTAPAKPAGGSSAPSTKPLVKTLSLNIYFDMASYAVNTTNRAKLVALAKRIAGLGSYITISISGYAQPTPGSEATYGLLSKRRAAEVAKIMRKYGVNTKVIYKGAGRAAVNDASSRYVEIVAANS